MRKIALLAVIVAIGGCLPPVSQSQLLADSAYDMNVATRFGRMDVALDFVGNEVRDTWMREHADWGRNLRVVDVELISLDMGAKEQANVVVSVLWQRLDEANLRTTQLTQSWLDGRGGWRMVSEKRTSGDLGLLGDRAKPAAAKESAPVKEHASIKQAPVQTGFGTTVIRGVE